MKTKIVCISFVLCLFALNLLITPNTSVESISIDPTITKANAEWSWSDWDDYLNSGPVGWDKYYITGGFRCVSGGDENC